MKLLLWGVVTIFAAVAIDFAAHILAYLVNT